MAAADPARERRAIEAGRRAVAAAAAERRAAAGAEETKDGEAPEVEVDPTVAALLAHVGLARLANDFAREDITAENIKHVEAADLAGLMASDDARRIVEAANAALHEACAVNNCPASYEEASTFSYASIIFASAKDGPRGVLTCAIFQPLASPPETPRPASRKSASTHASTSSMVKECAKSAGAEAASSRSGRRAHVSRANSSLAASWANTA